MNLRLLDLAEEDLLEGFRFYQRQPARVGFYFLETLYSDIESFRLFGGIHRQVLGYHRLLSKRFPYAIYYKIDGEEVAVWRVLDCRRNPKWIQKQLKPVSTKKRDSRR